MPTSWPALRTFVSVLGGALALGSVAAAQTPTSVFTIPGTVNAGGLNNTRFVSDLAVTNPGTVPVQATISFIPANGTTPKQKTLNAGETVVYRNVLDSLWGAQGAGATQVASDSPLLIRARTYNTAASGTYGVALPVFADDRLLSVDDSADSLWISKSADGDGRTSPCRFRIGNDREAYQRAGPAGRQPRSDIPVPGHLQSHPIARQPSVIEGAEAPALSLTVGVQRE